MNTKVSGGLSVMLLAVAAPALADSVSGQFAVEGKAPLKPAAAAAFVAEDKSTFVLLTPKPVDRAAIAKSSDPYSVAINDPSLRGTDYLAFWVDAKGKVTMNATVGGTQYMDTSGLMMGQKGSLVASCSSNTPEHAACSVKTTKTVKFRDEPGWSLDMTFDVAVTPHAAGK